LMPLLPPAPVTCSSSLVRIVGNMRRRDCTDDARRNARVKVERAAGSVAMVARGAGHGARDLLRKPWEAALK
jgi:hypothetical protein